MINAQVNFRQTKHFDTLEKVASLLKEEKDGQLFILTYSFYISIPHTFLHAYTKTFIYLQLD